MRNDKRGKCITTEQVASAEEAKRLKDAARYLGEEKRRVHRERRRVACLWLGFFAANCGILAGLTCSLAPRQETAEHAPPAEVWATDSGDGGVSIAGPVPPRPLKGQKRPPCDPKREKEINGGCWVEIVGAIGDDACGDYFAHGGRCHIPVKEGKRPPVGIEP